jgi:hypothetical protein
LQHILSSNSDRKHWGLKIERYPHAIGTGLKKFDPDATEIRLKGDIWMLAPMKEADFRAVWISSGTSTVNPLSAWHKIDQYNNLRILLLGFKFRRRLFFGSTWAASITFMLDADQIAVGWIRGRNINEIFDRFDLWTAGKIKQHQNLPAAFDERRGLFG